MAGGEKSVATFLYNYAGLNEPPEIAEAGNEEAAKAAGDDD